MNNATDHEQHALLVGKVVGNLLSLELAMRLYLNGATAAPSLENQSKCDLFALGVRDEVPEDAMTNYDTLGETIKRYNTSVSSEFRVDPSLR